MTSFSGFNVSVHDPNDEEIFKMTQGWQYLFKMADFTLGYPVGVDPAGTRGDGLKKCCCDMYHNHATPEMSRQCEKPWGGLNICYPTRLARDGTPGTAGYSPGTWINDIYHDNWCDKGTTMCSPWSTKTRWDIKYEGDSLIIYQGRPEILCFRSTILDRRLGDVLSEAINESVDALLNLFCDLSLGDILDTRIDDILDYIGRQSIGPLLPILETMMDVPAQATVGSLASQLYDWFRALPCGAVLCGEGELGLLAPGNSFRTELVELAADIELAPPLIGDLLDNVIFANIPVDGSLGEILGQVILNIARLQLTDTQTVNEFVRSALNFVGDVLVELLSILDAPNEGEPECRIDLDVDIGAAIICPVVNIAANLWELIRDNIGNILGALDGALEAITDAIGVLLPDGLLDDAAGYLTELLETDRTPCNLPYLPVPWFWGALWWFWGDLNPAVPIYNLLTTNITDYGLIGQVFVARGLLTAQPWTTACNSSGSCPSGSDQTCCGSSSYLPNCGL